MSTDFTKPTTRDPVVVAFGAPGTVFDLMPRWESIPEAFQRGWTPWNDLASQWFCNGLRGWPRNPKPGIDHRAALAHLSTILASFEPKHEHKIAAVAYLLSLWYEPTKLVPHKLNAKPKKPKTSASPVRPQSKSSGPLKGGLESKGSRGISG